MNLIYVIHLMCWNYLIALITHSRNRNNRNNSRVSVGQPWLALQAYKGSGLYRKRFQKNGKIVKKMFSDPKESMVKK